MKTGDIIEIHDGSWALIYEAGKLRHCSGVELQRKGPFEVVATNCILPTHDVGYEDVEKNSIIARNVAEGFIIFTQPFACSLKHKCSVCPHCGETIK